MTQEDTVHLLGASDVQHLASSIGINPTKKLGQNFMIDPGTVRRIAHASHSGPQSVVVEVGPGLGSLTLALLETGAQVNAIEIDPLLATQLPHTVEHYAPTATSRLRILTKDALKVSVKDLLDYTELDATQPFSLVSNLPYNVATPILLTFLEKFSGLNSAMILVQSEVAQRLSAQPGSKIYGSPSVKLAWYGTANIAGTVGRNVFWPVPNVDSALVEFHRFSKPQSRPEQLRTLTFSLIDAAFAQRRKTLRAALKTKASAHQIELAGIEPTQRGEKLRVDDFLALARVVASSSQDGKS